MGEAGVKCAKSGLEISENITLPIEKKSCIMNIGPGCAQICFMIKQSQDEVLCEKY